MEKREVIFAVFFATAVLLLLAAFLLLFLIRYRQRSNAYILERERLKKEYEQALMQARIEVQENTLSALGYELHDNIGQLLSSTKMLIGITQRNMCNAPDTLNTAEETLGKAISELRSLSKSLDKEWLQEFKLIENLQAEVARINSAKGLQISFSHPDNLLLSPDEQIILFRIIQEALQNVIKHSEANKIEIIIDDNSHELIIKINDDGKGFNDSMNESSGRGLKNMKQRTLVLGGTIQWTNVEANGTSVLINLPYKKD